MTMTQMYWLLMLDNIRILAGFMIGIGVITGLILAITAIHYCLECRSPVGITRRRIIILCGWLAAWTTVAAFLPSTKQMAAIIIVPRLCQAVQSNENLKAMPDKIIDLANSWLEELKPREGQVTKGAANK